MFPDSLKISKVMLLYKKTDESIDNYRPVSPLTSFSKVLEEVAYLQLTNHLKINELFYNSQYGLREDQWTESASFELIDRIITEIDNKGTLFVYIWIYQSHSIHLIMIYYWIN